MLKQAFLNHEPNPVQFMVKYLLEVSRQDVEPPPVNQPGNLRILCAQRQAGLDQNPNEGSSENVGLPINPDQPGTSRAFDNNPNTEPIPRNTLTSFEQRAVRSANGYTHKKDLRMKGDLTTSQSSSEDDDSSSYVATSDDLQFDLEIEKPGDTNGGTANANKGAVLPNPAPKG